MGHKVDELRDMLKLDIESGLSEDDSSLTANEIQLCEEYGELDLLYAQAKRFNGLTAEQDELLEVLSEECAEVIQAIAKIKRHGLESWHPNDATRTSNLSKVQKELGDVFGAAILLGVIKLVAVEELPKLGLEKVRKMQPFLHHHQTSDALIRQLEAGLPT